MSLWGLETGFAVKVVKNGSFIYAINLNLKLSSTDMYYIWP